ncbi:MAG: hypothetical protein KAW12_16860 [Candidatus Aminicenantes bacterium]|nr:hypothetical protein [Candidatus Aminicenantes bacterium]
MKATEKLLDFFYRRPDIREKFIFPGTFRDYALDIKETLSPGNGNTPLTIKIIEEARRILGKELQLDSLEKQLGSYPLISYADHHGLLNYKLLYNSNILYSLMIKELELPYVVVLATGNIPLMNISYPRGFYFKERKFNFFRKKQSNTPVFLVNSNLHAEKQEGIESFLLNYGKDIINIEEKEFLEYLFFNCLEIEKSAEKHNVFSDQITYLNYKLWRYYFDRSIRDSSPNLIYLQSNQIILSLLIEEIKKRDSLISLILFEPEARKVYLKNFYGIPGCWGENHGSHWFWGIVERKNKVRFTSLRVDDAANSLIGENFGLELDREAIVEALLAKKILPVIFFDFLIVTFMEGYLALGGLNQLEYLPQMQEAHIKSLEEIGMNDLVEKFAAPISHGLICGMYPFEFDSGIDLIWHYNSRDGKFNGNMDGGLTQKELDNVYKTEVTELIGAGIETTLAIL